MEQKDYMLREIQKIGSLLKAILSKLFLKDSPTAIGIVNYYEESKNELMKYASFQLNEFVEMSNLDAIKYLENQSGFNLENIEQLSIVLEELGLKENTRLRKLLFEKSLLTTEYCMSKDKTFSFEREGRMQRVKAHLETS
jgi:hypothetical protein